MALRVSDNDLMKKLLRYVLEANPEEISIMAEKYLKVKAVYDSREYCQWAIEPTDNYDGSFDVEGLSKILPADSSAGPDSPYGPDNPYM